MTLINARMKSGSKPFLFDFLIGIIASYIFILPLLLIFVLITRLFIVLGIPESQVSFVIFPISSILLKLGVLELGGTLAVPLEILVLAPLGVFLYFRKRQKFVAIGALVVALWPIFAIFLGSILKLFRY